MAVTPRGITDDYYNYLRSENGQAWHQQWLQRNGPLKRPHVTDLRSEENRKAFFYFWWNDFTLADMKEVMIAEGIRPDYKEYFSSVLPSKFLLTLPVIVLRFKTSQMGFAVQPYQAQSFPARL